jgi:hypothetical protein
LDEMGQYCDTTRIWPAASRCGAMSIYLRQFSEAMKSRLRSGFVLHIAALVVLGRLRQ